MRPRRCAWPSRSASRSASPTGRQVKTTPAKNGTACTPATWTGSASPVRAVAAARRQVLGAAAGQDPLGHGEQAVAGRRRRVGLKQGQPGELGGGAAGRVDVPRAQVDDAEVGHGAVGVPQRPDDERGLGDLVERRGRSAGTAPSSPPGRRPGAGRARRRTRRRAADTQALVVTSNAPRGAGHQASATPSRMPARSRRPSTARAAPLPHGAAAGTWSAAGGPAGHHRSCPSATTRCSRQSNCGGSRRQRLDSAPPSPSWPNSSSAPSASSSHTATAGHAEPGPQLRGERADELGAVLRPLGRRDGDQVVGGPSTCPAAIHSPGGGLVRARAGRPDRAARPGARRRPAWPGAGWTGAPGRARRRPSRVPAGPPRRPCRRAGGRPRPATSRAAPSARPWRSRRPRPPRASARTRASSRRWRSTTADSLGTSSPSCHKHRLRYG